MDSRNGCPFLIAIRSSITYTTIMAKIQVTPGTLWVPPTFDPDQTPTFVEIEGVNRTPTSQDELLEAWADYSGDIVGVASPSILGAVALGVDTGSFNTFASIDLCEVVRATHESVHQVERPNEKASDISDIHRYGGELSIFYAHPDILRLLMQNQYVQPVADIERIVDIMQGWRAQGVYVFANTSTLTACELPTVQFLKTHMPDAFDGIMFPRNHDGMGSVTKGHAASAVMQTVGDARAKTLVHIDDVPHHHVHVRNTAPEGTIVHGFTPWYNSSLTHDAQTLVGESPLETFERADEVLTTQLRAA